MRAPVEAGLFLLADIGGTHTRLAIKSRGGAVTRIQVFNNRDFSGLGELLQSYLGAHGQAPRPQAGALAVASPIEGDRIRLTNLPWRFSTDSLRRELGFAELHLLNDFTAIALALPVLTDAQRAPVGGPRHRPPRAALAVLGPGTGLGVSGMIPCGQGWASISGEGGHATLASADEEESRLLALLRPELEHVSAEKLLSGPGILQLYRGLGRLRGVPALCERPETVTAQALKHAEPLAEAALAMFFALLGGFAGDVALTLGARGGVYLAGGMLPALVDALEASAFRERFVAKGRFREYLEPVPTYVITDPYPALAGLGAWVDEQLA